MEADLERFLEGGADVALDEPDADELARFVEAVDEVTSPTLVSASPPAETPSTDDELRVESAEAAVPEEGGSQERVSVANKVIVAEDGMSATLRIKLRDGQTTTSQELSHLLIDTGVRRGLKESVLQQMAAAANGRPDRWVAGVVARGTEPRPGDGGGWSCCEPVPDGRASKALLAWASRRDGPVDGHVIEALPLARPGQVLARCASKVPPRDGTTVRGDVIEAEVLAERDLVNGPGVEVEGDEMHSSDYGYVCLSEGRLVVCAAAWLSDDGMSAFALLPETGLDPAAVMEELRRQGAECLPGFDRVASAIAGTEVGTVVVARGTEAVAGEDGRIEEEVDATPRVGTIAEDGSIDFKAINLVAQVRTGQRLAVVHPPTAGTPGQTLTGRSLPAADGVPATLEAGEGVAEEEAGQMRLFTAEIDGRARRENGVLQVRPELEVGDVCYETGNIDFDGDVIIKGTVQGGFEVRATGDVQAGILDNGARVQAGRDVVVRYGILGERTHVQASNRVTAQFIQEARVAAEEVEVGGYLYAARVSAARIRVHGRGDRGGVVGGTLVVRDRGDLASAGCTMGTTTKILGGVDPVLSGKLKRATSGRKTCADLIERLQADRRSRKGGPLAAKLVELREMEKRLQSEWEELQARSRALAKGARVVVRGIAYPGAAVVIGGHTWRPRDEIEGVVLQLNNKDTLQARAMQSPKEARP